MNSIPFSPLEAVIVLAIVLLILVTGPGLVYFIVWRATRSARGASAAPAPVPLPSVPPQRGATPRPSSAEVVASLTQRFCPHCRAPLDAASPQGLCPACLLAGALTGGMPAAVDSGLARTTPVGEPIADAGPVATLEHQFPNLEVLELLGQGGMGSVYKARQKHLDRIVAIKVIPPAAAANPAFAERFAREARALARLNHPNIVTVHDFGEVEGVFYLVMEYVDGLNLRQAMRAGQLSPAEALAIVPPVCDALQYAHDRGVVHRDIKPENVLLDRAGRVKIADFGLAKLLGVVAEDFTLTRSQQVMGTPRYMAPEQIETPSAVDHRADIYSLGVVFYEMLTGQLPLGRFDPPSHKAQLDVRIDEVVLRALEREPERRYQHASELKTGLESVVALSDHELPVSPAMPLPAWNSPAWKTPAEQAPDEQASFAQAPLEKAPLEKAPAWQPPVTKDFGEPIPAACAGAPLAMVLLVAFGILAGMLLISNGLALGVLALAGMATANLGGWTVMALGCLGVGCGSVVGSYSAYRQLPGAEDLVRCPKTTWLDWAMRGYLAIGLLLMLLASIDFADGEFDFDEFPTLLTFGGAVVLLAGVYFVGRLLLFVPGLKAPLSQAILPPWISPQAISPQVALPQKMGDPRRKLLQGRVAGPAIGLMLAGALGFVPCLGALLIVPAFTVRSVQTTVPKLDVEAPKFDAEQLLTPLPPSTEQWPQSPAPSICLPDIAGGEMLAVPGGAVAIAPAQVVPILAQQMVTEESHVSVFPLLAVVVWFCVNFALSATIFLGGWRMRQMKSYGLAMVAAVLALIPCTFGWFIALPMGIWALSVLQNAEVREAFES